jgi:hypothetical protein
MFGIFKPKAQHRAGERSFKALKSAWFGEPFPEYVNRYIPIWEKQYQETLETCKRKAPDDVINNVIDGIIHRFIVANDKARSMAQASKESVNETDAYTMAGTFTVLGLISHVVFAHAPAVAHSGHFDPDQLCFDMVTCIRESIENRKDEIHSDYADGATAILSVFLSSLSAAK